MNSSLLKSKRFAPRPLELKFSLLWDCIHAVAKMLEANLIEHRPFKRSLSGQWLQDAIKKSSLTGYPLLSLASGGECNTAFPVFNSFINPIRGARPSGT
ncbi:hypothetical protein [Synechococcus sp. Cruz CV12-2-Slac-r]|uniref:hypothetical protein n=1 Tax=Synechococcus sp. Cruz CV12-2-Slac-r TaxID=2823748 RepID=UPI0020CF1D4E|nr:hypothetical protein [Synechococcus sp. Cruz CV12-2-Slac-r]MCP9939521.1 hypothetical protein [Synechococcus sp. Cruz CV12-2-Slac-r]